jgi:hypothetical protein
LADLGQDGAPRLSGEAPGLETKQLVTDLSLDDMWFWVHERNSS